jgi:hypothetical protein
MKSNSQLSRLFCFIQAKTAMLLSFVEIKEALRVSKCHNTSESYTLPKVYNFQHLLHFPEKLLGFIACDFAISERYGGHLVETY